MFFDMLHVAYSPINHFHRILDLIILITVTYALEDSLIPNELARVLVVFCCFLMFVVFSFFHIYQSWNKTGLFRQLRTLMFAWFIVLVLFNLIIFLLSSREQLAQLSPPFGVFTSANFNYWALLVFSGLTVSRVVSYTVLGLIRSHGYNQQKAVIIGAGNTGQKLAHYLHATRRIGISVAGFFDDKFPEGTVIKYRSTSLGSIIGRIDTCYEFIVKEKVDLVFLSLPLRAEQKITRIVSRLGTSGHAVLMVQDLFSFGIQKARTQQLGELQVMDFYLFPVWKRIFDIIFSLLVVLTTFPLWLVIMIAVKTEDGGPVIFRHKRVMEGGKIFDCLKFRSMYLNAQSRLKDLLDQDPSLMRQWREHFKLNNDPRVTKVGKILRRFSIDELPQFLNVLSGEMSVVGARPVVPEELEKHYREIALTYCAMKPGITGLWQVSARDAEFSYASRVELDRQYILNCSIWMDLAIILKTIWRVISAKGI
jgi:exopolysaccharide biosynthesis polyprenyl glycosylphosphotransferase